MATIPQPALFNWSHVDASSDLDRLRLVLSALPDEALMRELETARGKGRNEYPIRPTWNAVIAGIVFQHPSIASLLRELTRNGELRSCCGFDALRGAAAVPTDEAMSRFLELLLGRQAAVEAIFHTLVESLGEALPDLGFTLACDSKAISSFGRPVKDEEKKLESDRRRDVDADWGVKTYKGTRKDGTAWEKVVKWFGYKLHLVVDSAYELPLAFSLTRASTGDSPELLPLVEQLEERHAEVARRVAEMACDKAYDSAANNAALYDDHGIKPVIDNRKLWKDETRKVLCAARYDVFSYDESGRVFCTCPSSRRGEDETRELAFVGFEKDRDALKYRCPAAHYGSQCAGRAECEKLSPVGVGEMGRIVRVPLETDRRIFTPIARHTAKWAAAYDRRTSVERVNSRLDRVLGFELHTIRGMEKMKLRVTLALVVMLAMALGRIRADQADLMRSMTAKVRRTG
jgi:hypothetical protein